MCVRLYSDSQYFIYILFYVSTGVFVFTVDTLPPHVFPTLQIEASSILTFTLPRDVKMKKKTCIQTHTLEKKKKILQ